MLISVVMPTYNGMRYLKTAVDSILAQEGACWELIIGDDGSSDGTREYLATLSDPRIKVHFNERNLGIFGNLNKLFAMAKGDITQIFCQDDWMIRSDALKQLVHYWMGLPPEIAFVRANHQCDSNSALARFEKQVLPSVVRPEHSDLFFLIFGCIPGNLSNVSIRTPLVAQCGGFDTALPYAGDFEFWARVGRQHPWAITDLHVATIRQHQGQASVSLNLKGELLPQLRHIIEGLFTNLRKRGYPAWLLGAMVSLGYAAQHRNAGLKKLLRSRDGSYLRLVRDHFDAAIYSGPPLLIWMLFFMSAGGRLLRTTTARALLRAGPQP